MCNYKEINIIDGDVIHIMLDLNIYAPESAATVYRAWKQAFPNNRILMTLNKNKNSILVFHNSTKQESNYSF